MDYTFLYENFELNLQGIWVIIPHYAPINAKVAHSKSHPKRCNLKVITGVRNLANPRYVLFLQYHHNNTQVTYRACSM